MDTLQYMDGTSSPKPSWRTFWQASLGSLILWLAQPPLGWWLLAWVAPAPWISLVLTPHLPGRRPYAALWLAGMVYWLLAVYWVCLPHPVTSLGWLALSAYLGIYLPLFVGLARIAVKRLHWPANVSCAVVWTGLQLLQAHLISGFDMAALGHTQFRWLELIQIADLGGGYLVSFVVMFVAASLTEGIEWPLKFHWRPLVAAAVLVAATLTYGYTRLLPIEYDPSHREPALTAALIQGSIDMRVVSSAEEFQSLREEMDQQYRDLTRQAIAERPDVDVVIWPETMVTESLVTFDADLQELNGQPVTRDQLDSIERRQKAMIGMIAREIKKPMLLGVDAWRYAVDRPRRFNSVVGVDTDGNISRRYDKSHPVMFGEYIPLADQIPLLYRITPLTGGIESGTNAESIAVHSHHGRDVKLCPSICYESVLAHVIRRQIASLAKRGLEPDILVNHTNDGWFRGSSELDMHLVCGVFRAVECRKPLLIAANTGLSAWIDGNGQIVRRVERRQTGWIVADVQTDPRHSLYIQWGDLPAGTCLLACAGLGAYGILGRRRYSEPVLPQ